MIKKTLCSFIAIFLLALPLVGCGSGSAEKQGIYESAIKAMDEYEYSEAMDLLNQIPDYKDVQEKIIEAQNGKKRQEIYEKAIKAIDDYKYSEALDLLNQIPDYKDAQEKIKKAQNGKLQQETYDKAIRAMEDYKYSEALNLLNQIPNYKGTTERIKEAKEGVVQEKFATYIFNFTKDGGFFNPSAVRVLSASYGNDKDVYSEMLGADGILYLKIQGTNKLGGTLSKEFVILIGGSNDGKSYSNDELGRNYNITDEKVDVPLINKMLKNYWQDYGIE